MPSARAIRPRRGRNVGTSSLFISAADWSYAPAGFRISAAASRFARACSFDVQRGIDAWAREIAADASVSHFDAPSQ